MAQRRPKLRSLARAGVQAAHPQPHSKRKPADTYAGCSCVHAHRTTAAGNSARTKRWRCIAVGAQATFSGQLAYGRARELGTGGPTRTMATDIAAWLRGLGLERYEPAFRDAEVTADVLPDLTEADLEKLGLPLGPRKKLLRAMASLGSENRPRNVVCATWPRRQARGGASAAHRDVRRSRRTRRLCRHGSTRRTCAR